MWVTLPLKTVYGWQACCDVDKTFLFGLQLKVLNTGPHLEKRTDAAHNTSVLFLAAQLYKDSFIIHHVHLIESVTPFFHLMQFNFNHFDATIKSHINLTLVKVCI